MPDRYDDAVEVSRPPLTVEGQESVMISLAMSEAERQLRAGTASSQIIVHFLKLGSLKERVELEKQRTETLLMQAKIRAIDNASQEAEIAKAAIAAMKKYQGVEDAEEYEDYSDIL